MVGWMMQRDWLGILGAVVLGASATTSCLEPVPLQSDIAGRLVEALCNDTCGCGGNRCNDYAGEEARRLTELAESFDLTFDEDCFAKRLEAHAAKDCRPASWDGELTCGVGCKLLHGDRAEGESCIVGGSFSTCEPGLVCVDEVCTDPCDRSGVGLACADFQCAYPAICDFTTEICVAPPADGEACVNGSQCEGGLECIAGTCRGPQDNGEPCMGHDHCRSRNCPAGFCAPRPVAGESCRGQIPCADGFSCEGEVCVAVPQPGDPCPCDSGQTCDDGVCRYSRPALSCGGSFLVK